MKKAMCLLAALSLLLSPCKSEKNLVPLIAHPVLNTDSICPNNSDIVARLFVPNASGLKKFSARREIAEKGQVVSSGITHPVPSVVARGTNITSFAVSVSSAYPGIDRVKRCEFTYRGVPEAFGGFCVVSISDLYYKSLFREKELESLVRLLNAQHTDVLLMGGDYQEGCQFVPEFFTTLARAKTPLGTYGVMGNNDYERCHDEIIRGMKCYGMHLLEHQLDTLKHNGGQIILAGVCNPFDPANNDVSPVLSLSPTDSVILLVHTPGYARDVSVANSDLVLVGHTHGGQVRIFGYVPIIPPHYGSWFLTGLECNSVRTPMIVTNRIGTLNKNTRIGAPAEIVTIALHRLRDE